MERLYSWIGKFSIGDKSVFTKLIFYRDKIFYKFYILRYRLKNN